MSARDIERALGQGEELCREIERFQRRVGGAMYLAGEGLEVPDHLNEAISEGYRALHSDIYYFRKHARQVDPAHQAAEIARLSAALAEKSAQLEEERARNAALKPVAWAGLGEDGNVECLGMNQSRRFDTPLAIIPGAKP